MEKNNKFKVTRDSREQKGWIFSENDKCLGTEISKLDTGDYTIKGMEDFFVIERKSNVSELASNLFQKRFHDELLRLDKFPHAYLILEFQLVDIINYPQSSNIPKHLWKNIKINGQQFLKLFNELQLNHPNLKIVFAGNCGKQFVMSLFKRMKDLQNDKSK